MQYLQILGPGPRQKVLGNLRHVVRFVGTVRLRWSFQAVKQPLGFLAYFRNIQRLGQEKFAAGMGGENIHQARMGLVHDEIHVSVAAIAVLVLRDILCRRPAFVVGRNAPVPILVPDGVGKDVQRPVIAEGIHHLLERRLGVKRVFLVMVIVVDRFFDGLLTGDVCLIGCPVLFDLLVIAGVCGGVEIDRQTPQGLAALDLFLQLLVGAAFQRVPDGVHVPGFHFCEVLEHIGQRRLGFQQRGRLFIAQIVVFQRHKNIGADRKFIGVPQYFLRGLA